MPTYEYVCEKCGHEFEVFQSMNDQPLTVCPKTGCPRKKWGQGKVKRKLGTGANLLFKGNGFYITDYRSEKYKEAAKRETTAAKPVSSDSKSSGGDAKVSSPKADSKPAKAGAKG